MDDQAALYKKQYEAQRDHNRKVKEMVLKALGYDGPWDVTTVKWQAIFEDIKRLREKAGGE